MATAFDTLTTYEAIAAAGIDDRGARAISKAIADSIADNRADLATKAELANEIAQLRLEMKAEFASMRELIASTQNRTLVWMFGMQVTFAGIIVAALKLG